MQTLSFICKSRNKNMVWDEMRWVFVSKITHKNRFECKNENLVWEKQLTRSKIDSNSNYLPSYLWEFFHPSFYGLHAKFLILLAKHCIPSILIDPSRPDSPPMKGTKIYGFWYQSYLQYLQGPSQRITKPITYFKFDKPFSFQSSSDHAIKCVSYCKILTKITGCEFDTIYHLVDGTRNSNRSWFYDKILYENWLC